MVKRVRVGLGNLKSVVAYLETYKTKMKLNNHTFVERLTKDAEVTLREKVNRTNAGLELYPFPYLKPTDLFVPDAEIEDNKGVVIMEGEDATFVEFGAGVSLNGHLGSSPHPRGAELGMTIGDYGKGYGQYTSWGYKDIDGLHVTRGVKSQKPLYETLLETKGKVGEIAKEVWK